MALYGICLITPSILQFQIPLSNPVRLLPLSLAISSGDGQTFAERVYTFFTPSTRPSGPGDCEKADCSVLSWALSQCKGSAGQYLAITHSLLQHAELISIGMRR